MVYKRHILSFSTSSLKGKPCLDFSKDSFFANNQLLRINIPYIKTILPNSYEKTLEIKRHF